MICITAFISPFREARIRAKQIIGEEQFLEVHIATDLSVCEKRDPKGLYKKARAGEVANFTGIDSPYEEPANPDLSIDTAPISVDDAVQLIETHLVKTGLLELR